MRPGAGTATATPAEQRAATLDTRAGSAGSPRGAARPAASSPGARSRARAKERRRNASRPRARAGGLQDALPLGERPRPPWHPLPLSELLIFVGAIGVVVGLSRGVSNGPAPLAAGLAAVLIGTVEVTLREHLSGYRSHAIIISLLPPVVLDSLLVALITPFTALLKVAMLLADAGLFAFLYKLLRARFHDARRQRAFMGRR